MIKELAGIEIIFFRPQKLISIIHAIQFSVTLIDCLIHMNPIFHVAKDVDPTQLCVWNGQYFSKLDVFVSTVFQPRQIFSFEFYHKLDIA